MSGKQTGVSSSVSQGELANETALTQIAAQQAQNGQSLYNLTEPGLAQSENFYSTIASGDPYAIARAISPETQQINAATTGAITNIQNNAPSGGEKNLAIENAKVAQGAQVGQASTGAFTGSFNALGQLAGQGVGESISAAGTGISGLGYANEALGQLGSQQLQGQNLALQQKGQTLGAVSSLAGDATSLAFL